MVIRHLNADEILKQWDSGEIDGAFVWGQLYDHLQQEGTVLVTAGDLANWGRETFNVVAVRRSFSARNAAAVTHMLRVIAALDADWILSASAPSAGARSTRWSWELNSSFVASVADAAALDATLAADRRAASRALESFGFITMQAQLTARYLDSGANGLTRIAQEGNQTAHYQFEIKALHTTAPERRPVDELWARAVNASYAEVAASSRDDQRVLALLSQRSPFPAQGALANQSTCAGRVELPSFNASVGVFTDGAGAELASAYSPDLACEWRVSPSAGLVSIRLEEVRIWTGDVLQIFAEEPVQRVLLGSLSALSTPPPPFESRWPLLLRFVTDSDDNLVYNAPIGDGVVVSYDSAHAASCERGCGGGSCVDGVCVCEDGRAGSDCSLDTCLGTRIVAASSGSFSSSSQALSAEHAYPNNAECQFVANVSSANGTEVYVQFSISYDLERTFDYFEVLSGYGQDAVLRERLTGFTPAGIARTVVVPTVAGVASLRFTTDAMGRRSGFKANFSVLPRVCDVDADCSGHGSCVRAVCRCDAGWHGLSCALPECSRLSTPDARTSFASQAQGLPVPALADCTWMLGRGSAGARVHFERFDLELNAQADSMHDLMVVEAASAPGAAFEAVHRIGVVACVSDSDCGAAWQTGVCHRDTSTCTVASALDVPGDAVRLQLLTDRNDLGATFGGVRAFWEPMDACPEESGACDGSCDSALCTCSSGRACDCSCAIMPFDPPPPPQDVDSGGASRVAVITATSLSVFFCLGLTALAAVLCVWWRNGRQSASRASPHGRLCDSLLHLFTLKVRGRLRKVNAALSTCSTKISQVRTWEIGGVRVVDQRTLSSVTVLQLLIRIVVVIDFIYDTVKILSSPLAKLEETRSVLVVSSMLGMYYFTLVVAELILAHSAVRNESTSELVGAAVLSLAVGLLPVIQLIAAPDSKPKQLASRKLNLHVLTGSANSSSGGAVAETETVVVSLSLIPDGALLAIAFLSFFFSLVFVWLCYLLKQEFGWRVFMKYGADHVKMELYPRVRLFWTIFKVDTMFSVLFCMLMLGTALLESTRTLEVDIVLGLIFAVCSIVFAFALYSAARHEHKLLTYVLLPVGILQVAYFSYVAEVTWPREWRQAEEVDDIATSTESLYLVARVHSVLIYVGGTAVRCSLLALAVFLVKTVYGKGILKQKIEIDFTVEPEVAARLHPREVEGLQHVSKGEVLRMAIDDSSASSFATRAPADMKWTRRFLQLSSELGTLRWSWSSYIGMDQVVSVRLLPYSQRRNGAESGSFAGRLSRIRSNSKRNDLFSFTLQSTGGSSDDLSAESSCGGRSNSSVLDTTPSSPVRRSSTSPFKKLANDHRVLCIVFRDGRATRTLWLDADSAESLAMWFMGIRAVSVMLPSLPLSASHLQWMREAFQIADSKHFGSISSAQLPLLLAAANTSSAAQGKLLKKVLDACQGEHKGEHKRFAFRTARPRTHTADQSLSRPSRHTVGHALSERLQRPQRLCAH